MQASRNNRRLTTANVAIILIIRLLRKPCPSSCPSIHAYPSLKVNARENSLRGIFAQSAHFPPATMPRYEA